MILTATAKSCRAGLTDGARADAHRVAQDRPKGSQAAMLTGSAYRESLLDGRKVYENGALIGDILAHPSHAIPIRIAADSYDGFWTDSGSAAENLYLQTPDSAEALRHHDEAHVDQLTHTTFTCYMTLLTAGDRIAAVRPQGRDAIHAYVADARRRDIRLVECITDAKGDRSLPPAKQSDPDAYLRVVERRADGVVIRGAKLHVSLAAIAHEMMVIPTKSMKPDEGDYAIACAVPVNAPGVKVVSVGTPPQGDLRDWPIAANRYNPQGFVIFEDVFVPWDRVFLDGETEMAGAFAHSLGLWLRASSLAMAADGADALVGLGQLIAEANGLEKVPHVREKITDIALHATLVRATYEASLATGQLQPNGAVLPNELYANAGKYLMAAERSLMLRHLLDIAGGSALTVPSNADFENPDIGDLLRKYMATKPGIDGAYRAKLFHAVRDVTVSAFAGYEMIGLLQGGGGLHAQRVVTRSRYDFARARELALAMARLDEGDDATAG
jgi:4-hydroxybutyryl-CoA dehydratase/vinylacetyl-CoA-Delta-isomerase